MARTGIQFTASDYKALPETAPRMELLDGEFEMAPAPSTRHQTVTLNVAVMLREFLAHAATGKVFISPCDVYLDDADVVQPDVLVLLNPHLEREREDGIHGAPDLVVEVISKTSGAQDMTLKRAIYRRGGVTEYWIVDPSSETVLSCRLQEPGEPRLLRIGESIASPLLPGFAGTLSEVFAR